MFPIFIFEHSFELSVTHTQVNSFQERAKDLLGKVKGEKY